MSEYNIVNLSLANQHEHLSGMIQLYNSATGDNKTIEWLENRLGIIRKLPGEPRVHVCYRYEAVVGFYLLQYLPNLHKNKAQIDEFFVAGDYSEGGVGDLLINKVIKIIKNSGLFKSESVEFSEPIHVELKMNIPKITKKITKGMSEEEVEKLKNERLFKLSFLKRNEFTEKRSPSKSTGISEYGRVLSNK